MSARRTWLTLAAAALLLGCSAPPTLDASLRAEGLAPAPAPLRRSSATGGAATLRAAIAPPVERRAADSTPYGPPEGDPPDGGAAADRTETSEGPSDGGAAPSEPSGALPAPLDDLHARLAEAVRWTGLFGDGVEVLPSDTGDLDRAREAADARAADLVLTVAIDDYRVRFLRDNGFVWWASLVTYWGFGPPFAWWIADEVFETRLRGELILVHARSGVPIVTTPFDVAVEEALNDFQYGFHLLSHLRVPESLDDGNWLAVDAELRPALLQRFQQQVARELLGSLPDVFGLDRVQGLLRNGTPRTARTFALVVGCNGPAGGTQRLRFAERDAAAVGGLLDRLGVRARDRVTLAGASATRGRVREAIAGLGQRTLGLDRLLVYASGFGVTLPETGEALVLADSDPARLAGTVLSLRELADLCTQAGAGSVTFVLDASFGGQGGRTFSGGVAPDRARYLTQVGDAARGFAVLAAAGPAQPAFSANAALPERQHGLLTYYLLGAQDSDGDGELGLEEVRDQLRSEVEEVAQVFWGLPQTPLLLGARGSLGRLADAAPPAKTKGDE